MKASSLDVSNVVVFKKMFTANYLIVTSETVYGHYKLRSFLHRIGIESEWTCSCQANIETTQHFLFYCRPKSTHASLLQKQFLASHFAFLHYIYPQPHITQIIHS